MEAIIDTSRYVQAHGQEPDLNATGDWHWCTKPDDQWLGSEAIHKGQRYGWSVAMLDRLVTWYLLPDSTAPAAKPEPKRDWSREVCDLCGTYYAECDC